MVQLLDPRFEAYFSYASGERERIERLMLDFHARNPDVRFDDPLDQSKTSEEDFQHVLARIAKKPLDIPVGHAMKITDICLNRIIENEGFVRNFGKVDSSGSDIEGAYAMLFGKHPFTICELEKYVNHPWVTFHSRVVYPNVDEFEINFRDEVRNIRSNKDSERNRMMISRMNWMRRFLELPYKTVGNKVRLYLAHATTHRAEVSALQEEAQKILNEFEIEFINPYEGVLGSASEKEIEDARQQGVIVPVHRLFGPRIVAKDVNKGIVASDGIVVLLNDAYTIGREKELVYGMLSGKQVTLGVCLDKRLYNHPLIRTHLDKIIYFEGVKEKDYREIATPVATELINLVEERRQQGLNQRVIAFQEFIRGKIKLAE